MDAFWQDLRYALRLFAKSPGFTFVAVTVLALGIGANTAIYSLINGALIRPLPGVSNPHELVLLERTRNGSVSSSGYPDYVDYRDSNSTLSGVAAHCGTPLTFDNGTAERLRGDLVTGNYFTVLGVKAALGRLVTLDDDTEPGLNPVAVLSHGFWLRAFGGASDVVGQTIRLNSYDFTIIGVAARDFAGTEKGLSFDVWIPIKMQAEAMPRTMGRHWFADRSAGWLTLFGRLKHGVSLDSAQAQVATLAKQLEQSYPNMNSGGSLVLLAGLGPDSEDRGSLRNFLGLLAAAVALLLLWASPETRGIARCLSTCLCWCTCRSCKPTTEERRWSRASSRTHRALFLRYAARWPTWMRICLSSGSRRWLNRSRARSGSSEWRSG